MSSFEDPQSLRQLERSLATVSANQLYQAIVDAPFANKLLTTSIDLGIVVLLLVTADGFVDRVALSNTELASGAVKVSPKPFSSIRVPLDAQENYIVQAITEGKHRLTEDWYYLFTPVLTATQARRNQTAASIESSLVWPLAGSVKGALIFSFYQPAVNITDNHLAFAADYAKTVSKRLTDDQAVKT